MPRSLDLWAPLLWPVWCIMGASIGWHHSLRLLHHAHDTWVQCVSFWGHLDNCKKHPNRSVGGGLNPNTWLAVSGSNTFRKAPPPSFPKFAAVAPPGTLAREETGNRSCQSAYSLRGKPPLQVIIWKQAKEFDTVKLQQTGFNALQEVGLSADIERVPCPVPLHALAVRCITRDIDGRCPCFFARVSTGLCDGHKVLRASWSMLNASLKTAPGSPALLQARELTPYRRNAGTGSKHRHPGATTRQAIQVSNLMPNITLTCKVCGLTSNLTLTYSLQMSEQLFILNILYNQRQSFL